MFIASLICLILGILLLIASAVIFVKLDVLESWKFIRNKRSGKKTINYSASRKRKRHNMSNKKLSIDNSNDAKHEKTIKNKLEETLSTKDVVRPNKVSSFTNNFEDEESEQATGLLVEESEQATGLLDEQSESPTGLLDEQSESPTGLLEDDSEQETGILSDNSELPTGILEEESELPTGILDENKVHKVPKSAKKKIYDGDFKFEIIKDIVVIHTDESIT